MSEHTTTVMLIRSERQPTGDFDRALKTLPFSFKTAQDGVEAIARLKAAPAQVGVVLLDVTTTQESGIEIIREIRQLEPQLPVIVLSEAAPAPATIVSAM